jgi:phosphoglycolate phosphatase
LRRRRLEEITRRNRVMKPQLKNYSHIIWDWNGTLLDDAWLCVDIMNTLLRRRNKPQITPTQYEEIFDFPVKEYYRKVGFDFSYEPFETLATEYIVEYDKRQLECTLRNQAREILQFCREYGMTQSILSACHQERLENIVNDFEIRPFFIKLIGLSNYYATCKKTNGKKLLADLHLRAEEVLLIGDTTHDFDVAKALGTDCVLIHGGHHSREKLDSTGSLVKNSLGELLEEDRQKSEN